MVLRQVLSKFYNDVPKLISLVQ
jgi:nucleolin